MIITSPKKTIGVFLCVAFAVLCPSAVRAAADSLYVGGGNDSHRVPLADRFAVRTNAFEWLLTIPNAAVEFDLTGSEFNSMTIGLSAKYNWNTSHTYSPPAVFNLFDVRPEFRYYFRTRPVRHAGNGRQDLESFLKDRKIRRDRNGNEMGVKSWRAHYVGAYLNYGTYAFKLGRKGYQGNAFGIGLSAGYSIPMYEYRNGAVDVELGFSAGLQVCTRDLFVHNPNGYFYTKVEEGSKPLHLTPFPVVSDVRVAFVWRHKSIKDKVKEDADRNRVKRYFNTIVGDYNYNDFTKASYDEYLENTKSGRERRDIMASDSLYRAGFEARLDEQEAALRSYLPNAFPGEFKSDSRVLQIVNGYESQLEKLIIRRKKKAMADFLSEWEKSKEAVHKAEKKRKGKEAEQ